MQYDCAVARWWCFCRSSHVNQTWAMTETAPQSWDGSSTNRHQPPVINLHPHHYHTRYNESLWIPMVLSWPSPVTGSMTATCAESCHGLPRCTGRCRALPCKALDNAPRNWVSSGAVKRCPLSKQQRNHLCISRVVSTNLYMICISVIIYYKLYVFVFLYLHMRTYANAQVDTNTHTSMCMCFHACWPWWHRGRTNMTWQLTAWGTIALPHWPTQHFHWFWQPKLVADDHGVPMVPTAPWCDKDLGWLAREMVGIADDEYWLVGSGGKWLWWLVNSLASTHKLWMAPDKPFWMGLHLSFFAVGSQANGARTKHNDKTICL